MAPRRYAICVSTSKPSTTLTPGGGGGSVTLLCPHTGSILSSLRTSGGDSASKSVLGMSCLSPFPERFSSSQNTALLLAYGSSNRKDDTYGMLMSLRKAPLPPFLHWKCRLPEAKMSAGLVVSPCGHYVVGGAASGTCFVWKSLGGSLVRTVRAHYRSVTAIAWSDCGQYLVTGGADGMVHAFSMLDLVDSEAVERQTVVPLRSWSYHHLSVTALKPLPSGRMATSSFDCIVAIIEIFSDSVVLTVQMPHPIHALDFTGGRLYAGANQGSIYTIDLDVYAMHQTSQLGVTVKRPLVKETFEDHVFGEEYDTILSYKSELHGHSKPITSLAIVKEDSTELLVSGDEGGTLRVWDLESRGCIRIIEPWTHSIQNTTAATAGGKMTTVPNIGKHPVTSILVVPRGDDVGEQKQSSLGAFGSGVKDSKTHSSIVTLVTPLQKFTDNIIDNDETESIKWTPVPFLQSIRSDATPAHGTGSSTPSGETIGIKRRKVMPEGGGQEEIAATKENGGLERDAKDHAQVETQNQEVLRLQRELEEAKKTIKRWEKVNNKLAAKLKQASSKDHQ